MTWEEKIEAKLDKILDPNNIPILVKALLGYVMIITLLLIFFPTWTIQTTGNEPMLLAVYLANALTPLTFFVIGYFFWTSFDKLILPTARLIKKILPSSRQEATEQ